ncbi:MAG: NAD-dependent epimerase/dehydratase family protein [Pseudomonadota bacterium]
MTVLVTGAAGFIGAAVSHALLDRGEAVLGVDNLNDYYRRSLKDARLARLEKRAGFSFQKLDLADADALKAAAQAAGVDRIVHLAAQAGVRYSIENPFAYVASNLQGHVSVLELARAIEPSHTVYASSSSVYGGNTKTPFAEDDVTVDPVSLYGATKMSDELLSNSYARLYGTPLTGLRFFTVYGEWGRPDMAYWIFTEKMLRGETIRVFNNGKMGRDFTYIADVVAGILAALDAPASGTPPHRVYNIGNDRPEELMTLITSIETALGAEAVKSFEPMQPGDVERTWADITRARSELGYDPKTPLEEGVARFVDWYRREGPFETV